MTLIETTIALAVLVLVLGGFSRAVVSSVVTADQHAETRLALDAARRMIEVLQATDFGDVYALYNDDPGDDLAGAPGPGFAVQGLQPLDDDPDGLVGEVVFPTVGMSAAQELREDVVDARLGMPRDLNGDGQIDSADHGGDYAILPVVVRVRWRGAAGPAKVELTLLLADY